VALTLADEEGFEGLSMRRVASTLGSGTMTLYNYVRTKDELIALMDDALMAEALVPEGELPDNWRDALVLIARRTRAALVRHPWVLGTLGSVQFGPNAMRHVEQSLGAVSGIGLDPAGMFELLSLVDDYVQGHVLRASESRKRLAVVRDDPETVHALVEFGMERLRTGEFPHMAALLGDRDPLGPDSPGPALDEQSLTDQFERGLRAVLDGAAALLGIPSS
jgi:AcrR family transcriptional regulator